MWITRAEYDALVRENARLATSCEWFASQVNQLNHERAVLLERILDLKIAVPEIAVAPAAAPPPGLTPERLRAMADRFAPAPEGERGQIFNPKSTAVAEAENAMALFEDMDDETARRAGVSLTPDGELSFGRL